jgi:hypothetical protein
VRDSAVDLRDRAVKAFAQAAGMLCEYPFPRPETLAAVLLHASLGLHLIARMDSQQRALVLAEQHLKAITAPSPATEKPRG